MTSPEQPATQHISLLYVLAGYFSITLAGLVTTAFGHALLRLMEKYLTTEEVAEIARTSASTVRYWKMTGKGPKSVKRGRRVLYAESAVEQWLANGDDDSK